MSIKTFMILMSAVSLSFPATCQAGGIFSSDEKKDEGKSSSPPVKKDEKEGEGSSTKTSTPKTDKSETHELVPYRTVEFRSVVVPYPATATQRYDEETSSFIYQVPRVCTLTIYNSSKEIKPALEKCFEGTDSYKVPSGVDSFDFHVCKTIFGDIRTLGDKLDEKPSSFAEVGHFAEEARRLIQTLEHMIALHGLRDNFKNLKLQKNRETGLSRMMIDLENNVRVVVEVEPLPSE